MPLSNITKYTKIRPYLNLSKRFIGTNIIFRVKNGQIASIMLWYLSEQEKTIKIMYNVLVINILTSTLFSYFRISMAQLNLDETKTFFVFVRSQTNVLDINFRSCMNKELKMYISIDPIVFHFNFQFKYNVV